MVLSIKKRIEHSVFIPLLGFALGLLPYVPLASGQQVKTIPSKIKREITFEPDMKLGAGITKRRAKDIASTLRLHGYPCDSISACYSMRSIYADDGKIIEIRCNNSQYSYGVFRLNRKTRIEADFTSASESVIMPLPAATIEENAEICCSNDAPQNAIKMAEIVREEGHRCKTISAYGYSPASRSILLCCNRKRDNYRIQEISGQVYVTKVDSSETEWCY